jgi:hypothetical protein
VATSIFTRLVVLKVSSHDLYLKEVNVLLLLLRVKRVDRLNFALILVCRVCLCTCFKVERSLCQVSSRENRNRWAGSVDFTKC